MAREFVLKQKALLRNMCMDCGLVLPPYCLDFDHRTSDKWIEISRMVGRGFSPDVIAEEISKCDLVCANCHRERTHDRSEDRKLERIQIAKAKTEIERNLLILQFDIEREYDPMLDALADLAKDGFFMGEDGELHEYNGDT